VVTNDAPSNSKLRRRERRKAKASLYRGFVKSAKLSDGVERKEGELSSEEEDEEDKLAKERTLTRMTDEELLKVCGGMTAHK